MLKNWFNILLLAVFTIQLYGQEVVSDTIDLGPVTISASRITTFAIGQELIIADSLDRSEDPSASIGDVIPGMSSLHVNNYGSGTLTTLSLRGTSANQTGLVWNGISLSPPNLGYVDLSLLRADFFDNISVLYGGASPMFGSGSIGGSLHLDNIPDFDDAGNTLTLGTSAGSFGKYDGRLNYQFSGKRFYNRTAGFYRQAANDFPYRDLQGQIQFQDHGNYSSFGTIQEFAFQVNEHQVLQAIGWLQYADRNIPPTLTESTSTANQVDRSARIMLGWKGVRERSRYEAKGAYFNEFTRYTDPRLNVYSTIKTQTAVARLEGTWSLFKQTSLFGGVNYTYDYGDLAAYDQIRRQSRLALFASILQPFWQNRWKVAVHLRQEFLTDYRAPFIFGVSAEGMIYGPFHLAFSASRNFRAPTMNERFWQPGGNPELLPEESWNADLGIIFRQSVKGSLLEFRLTTYQSIVDNWIQWVPGVYWSAENARKVWARGLEMSGEQHFDLDQWKLSLKESYAFTRSTNEKSSGPGDEAYQKQLIYVPLHSALLKINLEWKGYGLTIRQSVSSKVYTSSDNSSSLPAFYLLDVLVGKTWIIPQHLPLTLSVGANNILDKEYQVTPYRPMPGINFMINLSVKLDKQNKKR